MEHLRSLGALLVTSLLVAGCTSDGPPTPPGQCPRVECNPPTCCGASCTPGSCCEGTVCSIGGRCIPEGCRACGELGCSIDFDACTFECNPPTSCLSPCADDSGCPAGTHCGANSMGSMACFPDICESCGGEAPICRVRSNCESECVAPDSCGVPCTTDAECGAGAICHRFTSTGNSLCVPRDFGTLCGFCPAGCSFYGATCTVRCSDPPVDAGPPPVDAAATDAGPGTDAAPPPVDASVPPMPDAGLTTPCAACCEPCAEDSDCCSGNYCGRRTDGARICFPIECAGCGMYGCTVRCP